MEGLRGQWHLATEWVEQLPKKLTRKLVVPLRTNTCASPIKKSGRELPEVSSPHGSFPTVLELSMVQKVTVVCLQSPNLGRLCWRID